MAAARPRDLNVRVAFQPGPLPAAAASTPTRHTARAPPRPQELAEARDGRQGAARQPAEGRTLQREGRMAPECRLHCRHFRLQLRRARGRGEGG